MSEETIPAVITQQAQTMMDAISLPPTIEPVRPGRWRISFSNDRVAVTVDYKVFPRFGWAGSTLAIDGKPRRLADNLEHLARFFKDTDATLAELYVPVVVPENADVSEAPSFVRHIYAVFAGRLQTAKIQARITRTKKGWCVGLYMDERLIELSFIRHNRRWIIDPGSIRLVVDNEELNEEIRSIGDALSHLFDGAGQRPQGRQAIGNTRQAQGPTNSVAVRNATVFRI